MSKKLKILGQNIEPNGSYVLSLDIARLHTRTKLDLPIIIERGAVDGPVLLITAGIHGNEINGVEIVRQIISKGYNKPEKGTIICIPILNIFGYINQTREFPDGRDLNRVFPGSKTGSLASRFAYSFMKEIVPYIDYCIDYHTGGASRFNYTHLRVNEADKESLELAKTFGIPYILFAKNREQSFRETLVKLNKKVLLFEGGKTLFLDKTVTKIGVDGAKRVIQHLGMKNFNNLSLKPFQTIILEKASWVRAHHSGLYRSFVSVGTKVKKGEKLGSIASPFGDFEKFVKCPHDGYVISSNHSPIVVQGDALINLGIEKTD